MSEPLQESLELLRGAKAGDSRALNQLLARYQGRLLERIRLMMGEKARVMAESSDFLQETLLDVAKGLDAASIESEAQLLRWMTEVARNNIRDEVRRPRERCFDTFSTLLLAGGMPAQPVPTPPSEVLRLEEQHRVAECMEELAADQRRVLELRHFEGLAFEEIGARMGRSANAVQLLHTRALVRLGALLGG